MVIAASCAADLQEDLPEVASPWPDRDVPATVPHSLVEQVTPEASSDLRQFPVHWPEVDVPSLSSPLSSTQVAGEVLIKSAPGPAHSADFVVRWPDAHVSTLSPPPKEAADPVESGNVVIVPVEKGVSIPPMPRRPLPLHVPRAARFSASFLEDDVLPVAPPVSWSWPDEGPPSPSSGLERLTKSVGRPRPPGAFKSEGRRPRSSLEPFAGRWLEDHAPVPVPLPADEAKAVCWPEEVTPGSLPSSATAPMPLLAGEVDSTVNPTPPTPPPLLQPSAAATPAHTAPLHPCTHRTDSTSSPDSPPVLARDRPRTHGDRKSVV